MIVIDSEYNLGQYVYLKTDVEQSKRIVTAIHVRSNGISYELSCGSNDSTHYDYEISETKDILIDN